MSTKKAPPPIPKADAKPAAKKNAPPTGGALLGAKLGASVDPKMVAFAAAMRQAYPDNPEGAPNLVLGGGMLDGVAVPATPVRVPLKMLNRHGLIAGATGTGKTKTIQVLAERLSFAGVPTLVMDIKGDLSGVALPGVPHKKIDARQAKLGLPWTPTGTPVELLTLADTPGVRLRATVTEFGPVLFSKILNLNETQSGVAAIVFRYCDERQLALIDLKDFRTALNYILQHDKKTVEREYGRISSASAGTIVRKIATLEQQGGDRFFGDPSFEVGDLLEIDADGRGKVNILRLQDVQDKPGLFSTFMLSLLSEVYNTYPEAGDLEKPKLCIFIDEAHLIFENATAHLLDQLETMAKLIRSKGVGLYFCTQNPQDIPDGVLSQLGLKIQHALRAFTAKDRKAIKLAAQNYPDTKYYDTAKLLTELGIGEALVTALGPKGRPTELVHTLLRAPESRMGVLKGTEITHLVSTSPLAKKYNVASDPESAYEKLQKKMQAAAGDEAKWKSHQNGQQTTRAGSTKGSPTRSRRGRTQKSMLTQFFESTTVRQIGRTVAREVSRGLLGALGIKTSSRSRRR
ncbi:MAG: helicase HerA-like domain-containing protein [Verrucomicrobiota bacterium]